MMVGEVEVGVLKSIHNVYVSDKSFLATDGNMSDVPLRFVPLRNNHSSLMSSGEDSQKNSLSCLDGDDDVPDILFNMLTKSQEHKKNDD